MALPGTVGVDRRQMRGLALILMSLVIVIGLAAQPRTAFAQPTTKPAPGSAAAICHECDWIRTQIGDIDDKVASWERQIDSINRHANLADPRIQNALKDIRSTIAALKAKKAELQGRLADCDKRCAAARAAETPPVKPVTPGPSTTGAKTGDESGSASAAVPGGQSGYKPKFPLPLVLPKPPPLPPPPPDCPKATGPTIATPDYGWSAIPFRKPKSDKLIMPPIPPIHERPAAPSDPYAKENWDHLQWHMDMAESDLGDDEDVWDVVDDLSDSIRDARNELAADPTDEDARERLDWLKSERDFYEDWQAYIRIVRPRYYITPLIGPNCPPLRYQAVPGPAPLNDFNPNAVPSTGTQNGVLLPPTIILPKLRQPNPAGDDNKDNNPTTPLPYPGVQPGWRPPGERG